MKTPKIFKITLATIIGMTAFGVGMYAMNDNFTAKASTHNVENGVCIDCNEEFAVMVIMEDEERYYATFAEALEAVAGKEQAEIRLLCDTEGVSGWVETNLTLDLNGFTLSNAQLSTTSSSDVAYSSISILDYSSAQTGAVTGVAGAAWTLKRGHNYIYSGNYAESVGWAADNADAWLYIYGGKYELLSVQMLFGAQATLDGFTAERLHLSTYQDGRISVENGSFQYWSQTENLSSWLAEGYKIFDSNGLAVDANVNTLSAPSGEYYTIKKHAECYYEDYARTDTEHWVGCTCGATEGGVEPVKEAHTWEDGGCSVCYISHKHESFDENGYCSVCDYQMPIAVIDGKNVSFYGALDAALSKIPENATLKLLRDTGTIGESLDITKPMTLDLNGKRIEAVSSENIYIKAPVTIIDKVGSGFIDIDVVIESEVVLKGGEFLHISLEAEGMTYSDLLGAGYHYYAVDAVVGEDQPLTEEQIVAMTWPRRVKIVCDCEHTGGTATCMAYAVCEVCGNEYGELGDHVVDTHWQKDETHHWHDCVYGVEGVLCNETLDKTEHVDADGDYLCDDCGWEFEKPVKKAGCGSVIGGGTAVAIIGAAAIAVAFRKRKEN